MTCLALPFLREDVIFNVPYGILHAKRLNSTSWCCKKQPRGIMIMKTYIHCTTAPFSIRLRGIGVGLFIMNRNQNRSSWSRGSVPSSHARGQWFEPRRRKYFKLLLDPGDFHSNPSGLLSFNKSETVLWTIAKILL